MTTAYSVISDPQERKWYDDHRESILRSGGDGTARQSGDDGEDGLHVILHPEDTAEEIKEAEMDIDTLEELDRTGGEGVNRFRKRKKSAPGVYVPTSVTPRGKKIIKRLGGEDLLAVNLSSFNHFPNCCIPSLN